MGKKENIISQETINCEVSDIEDAKNFIEVICYKNIMCIEEEDVVYSKDGFELAVKDIKNGDKLIEVETDSQNSEIDTVEKIKNRILQENLPIYENNYFVKKAEIELNKILER